MAAYLKTIFPRTCQSCRKPATVTLCNTYNEPIVDYCQPCGNKALATYQREWEKFDTGREAR